MATPYAGPYGLPFGEVHLSGPPPVPPLHESTPSGGIVESREHLYGVADLPVRGNFTTKYDRAGAIAATQPPPDTHPSRSPITNPIEWLAGHQGARQVRTFLRELDSLTGGRDSEAYTGRVRQAWRVIYRSVAGAGVLAASTAIYNRLPDNAQSAISHAYENVTGSAYWAIIGGTLGTLAAMHLVPDGARDRAFGAPNTSWYPQFVGRTWRAMHEGATDPYNSRLLRVGIAVGGTILGAAATVVGTAIAPVRGVLRRRGY